MSEAEELVERAAARSGPGEWVVALEEFRDAYGGEADFENMTDRYLLLRLLRDAVRLEMEREMVEVIQRQTARIRELGR
jgi:hypothetical protein